MPATLGVRLNNPGNIELTSVRWKGLAPKQLHKRFATFVAPQWGIRAIARILLGDWREGQNTIASLITEWAPPHENPTAAYIAYVAKGAGVDGLQAINVPALLPKIIAGIVAFENAGYRYPGELVQLGIDLERSA